MAEYSKAIKELGEPDDGAQNTNPDEEVTTVTFKLPKSTLERLNKRAKELGVTRSFLIRRGVTEILSGGPRSRINKLVLVTSFDTFDENGAPIEHSRVITDDNSNARLVQLVSELVEESDATVRRQHDAA